MPRVSDKKIFFRGDGGLHGFQAGTVGESAVSNRVKGGLKKIDCRLREGGGVVGESIKYHRAL